MKGFFSFIGGKIGYWIMWLSLFCIIGALLFPFSLWGEVKAIFKIIAATLPIGFVLRFISLDNKPIMERFLYIVRDIFVILILVTLPTLAIVIAYYMKYNIFSYGLIVKPILVIIIGITGAIVINIVFKKQIKASSEDE